MSHRANLRQARRAREPRKGPDLITAIEFQWMCRYLRRKARLPKGVRIRWILDPDLGAQGYAGMCDDHDSHNRFTIQIDSGLSSEHCYWALCHELAHVRQRIFHVDELDNHGPGFGIEFAFMWRAATGEQKTALDEMTF